MRKHLALVAIAAAVGAGAAGAAAPTKPSSFDRHFVVAAAQSNGFEIAAGNRYARRGGGQGLCGLAKRLVTDHTRSMQELTALAVTLHVKLTQPFDPLLTYDVQQMSRLQAAPVGAGGATAGQTLDQGSQALQIAAHKHAILEFQEAARAADDARLRAFAQRMLPKLREHLKMARDANGDTARVANGACNR
jgi:putative membrane protein